MIVHLQGRSSKIILIFRQVISILINRTDFEFLASRIIDNSLMNGNNKTSIAVIEDHSFFRSGLAMALQDINFVELTVEAANGQEFIDQLKVKKVDIALLDVKMPKMNGYDTLMKIKQEFPSMKIVMLTMHEDYETIYQFIKAGVDGYLSKNIDVSDLEIALKTIINGQIYYSIELMGHITRMLQEDSIRQKRKTSISKRELEILKLIFDGYSNKEIADKLFVSIRTITNHRMHLNAKTGVKNTAGLIAFSLKNNLLSKV